jgi:hypothetical protein
MQLAFRAPAKVIVDAVACGGQEAPYTDDRLPYLVRVHLIPGEETTIALRRGS